jgi:hypothetical protein
VGLEWMYAEFVSKCHRLLVTTLSLLDLCRLMLGIDGAEQPKGPGLVPPLLTLAAAIEGTPSELNGVIPPPG